MSSSVAYDSGNVFARILRGEIPVQPVFADEHVLAFPDIAPKAPVHVLVIPRGAYVDLADFSLRAGPEEITALYRAVGRIVADFGLSETGFRAIANSGLNGGQEVPHFHLHILGGKPLGPMVSQVS